MSEETSWAVCVGIIALAAVLITTISLNFWLKNNEIFSKGGYVECMLSGKAASSWCKP